MLEKLKINLKLSEEVKSFVERRVSESGLKNPMPGIDWGKWDDEKEEGLMIGSIYDYDTIPKNDPIRIIEADGMEFIIMQDWLCKELDGKRLEVVNNKLTIVQQKE